MNPLDRPSIRKLVDGHQARGEDPWLLLAGLYAKLDQAGKEKPHWSCAWATWAWDDDCGDEMPTGCTNTPRDADLRCRDHLVRVLLDRNGKANINLCDEHWAELEKRLRPVARLVYEEHRLIVNQKRDSNAAVYFLKRDDGLVKIGFSSDVDHRVRSLEEVHGPLKVLRVEEGGRNREAQLHRKFAKQRVTGEWFRPSPELREYVDGQ